MMDKHGYITRERLEVSYEATYYHTETHNRETRPFTRVLSKKDDILKTGYDHAPRPRDGEIVGEVKPVKKRTVVYFMRPELFYQNADRSTEKWEEIKA